MAVPADQGLARPHADPYLGDIGTNGPPLLRSLPDATQADRLAIPAIEDKDSVVFGDGIPALDIGERLSGLDALADGAAIELGGEGAALFGGEAHHWLRT